MYQFCAPFSSGGKVNCTQTDVLFWSSEAELGLCLKSSSLSCPVKVKQVISCFESSMRKQKKLDSHASNGWHFSTY